MLYKSIEVVEFDLNTVCNSYCPPCHRYTVQDGELFHNPYVKLNTQLDIEVIKRVFDNDRIEEYCCVDLVGLVGEPVAHPKFMEIIDIIYERRPKATINLHTNGGLRTEKFYYDLGKKLNSRSWVKFALDGLEDTNGIYRIGVDFNKALNNMKAFIAGGGNAIWKMVIFEWNKHQEEEAKALSEELGCVRFQRVMDVNSQEIDRYMSAAQNKINKKVASTSADMILIPPGTSSEIEDQCFSQNKVYVNAHGFVIPCCMVNSATTYESMRDQTLEFIKEDRSPDWNSLYYNDFETIMSDTWWQKLKDSFEDKPCAICIYSCGKESDGRIID